MVNNLQLVGHRQSQLLSVATGVDNAAVDE